MKVRFIYFNKINQSVESVYITLNAFEANTESYKKAEEEIFKHLYKDRVYSNEISILNYRIMQ